MKPKIDRNDPSLEEIRTETGLSDAKFLGYVVHLPDSDEYAAKCELRNDSMMIAWAKSPELAQRFNTRKPADNITQAYGKNNVVTGMLFETNDQYFVICPDPE